MLPDSEAGILSAIIAMPDGTRVSGVLLTITYLSSELERVTVTNSEGEGRYQAIPPGGYELRAELEGFNPVINPDIDVRAGQDTRVEITLLPI